MNRSQLEHVIRAAATIADDDDIVVVGSQAVLAISADIPAEMLVSLEADVYPRNRPERSDLIDGSIGEGSVFHETFGYYAHGVGPETAVLPEGWSRRVVPLSNDNTRGATGWCLEVHDAVVSKLVAGRDKDFAYADAALAAGIVEPGRLRSRTAGLTADTDVIERTVSRVERLLRSGD